MTDHRTIIFNITSANQLMPYLHEAMIKILQLNHHLSLLMNQMGTHAKTQHKLDMVYDRHLDHHQLNGHDIDIVSGVQLLLGGLQKEITAIEETGINIRDILQGQLAFPSQHMERNIWLSWAFGEPSVGFWFEHKEKFDDRKPLSKLTDDCMISA